LKVLRIQGRPGPEDQFGLHELRQGVIQLLPRHRRRGADQLVRELTPESGGDLCHLARQRQAVAPRQ
jgi:hypothetical protein